MSDRRSGALATVIGGLLGVGGGFGIGLLIAYALPVDENAGLEALGTFLLVVFLAAFIGGGIGSVVALMIRRHPRPVLTGALAVPALAAVTIATLRLFGDQDSAVVLVLLVIAFAATFLLVRVVAMLGYAVKGG